MTLILIYGNTTYPYCLFLSLINPQHLKIINHNGNEPYNYYENVDWK